MKSEIKKIDDTVRELTVEVSGEVVKAKFEDVFKRITQEAKVPGFRPGNAPRDLIEKNFSAHAHEQVLKELIPDLYNEAINKEGLDVLELPEVSDVKLDRSSISFKAKVEVNPEIPLKDYKGIKVIYKNITVTSDEIKRSLDSVKESRKLENIDDAFARGAGYPNLAELEKALEHQIVVQKENQQRQDIENHIIEILIKDLDFKIPESLIKRQLADLVKRTLVDLAMRGVPKEKIDEQEKAITANLEPEARKQVKVYLVLAAIAKKENIALDDHMPAHVIEFLLREADWQSQ